MIRDQHVFYQRDLSRERGQQKSLLTVCQQQLLHTLSLQVEAVVGLLHSKLLHQLVLLQSVRPQLLREGDKIWRGGLVGEGQDGGSRGGWGRLEEQFIGLQTMSQSLK